jgi:hypothetical protein
MAEHTFFLYIKRLTQLDQRKVITLKVRFVFIVDTRRPATAPAFFYLTKRVFFFNWGKQRFYWSRHLVI